MAAKGEGEALLEAATAAREAAYQLGCYAERVALLTTPDGATELARAMERGERLLAHLEDPEKENARPAVPRATPPPPRPEPLARPALAVTKLVGW